MKVEIEMFGMRIPMKTELEVFVVEVSDEEIANCGNDLGAILNTIFAAGIDRKNVEIISLGDVIRYGSEKYKVCFEGLLRLDDNGYDEYVKMSIEVAKFINGMTEEQAVEEVKNIPPNKIN